MRKSKSEKLATTDSQMHVSLGEQLRVGREKLGLSVAEVAVQLHMIPLRIEELEQDQYENMAGATYTRGYLRNYARLVKLDDSELLHLYEQVQDLSSGERTQPLIEPMLEGNLPHHRDSAARYIGLLLLLALLMIGGWWWQSQRMVDNSALDTAAINKPSADAVIVAAEPGSDMATDSIASSLATDQADTSTAGKEPSSVITNESAASTPIVASRAETSASESTTTPGLAVANPGSVETVIQIKDTVKNNTKALRSSSSSEPSVARKSTPSTTALVAKSDRIASDQSASNTGRIKITVLAPLSAVDLEKKSKKITKKSVDKPSPTVKNKPSVKPGDRNARLSKKPAAHLVNNKTGLDSKQRPVNKTRPGVNKPVVVKKKKSAMPRLQLSDDYRTLMLYFDLGSWVDIRDSAGKRLMNRMVVQGRTLSVQGAPPFQIFLGNRQGVRIMYRGKPVLIKDNGTGMFARFEVGQPLSTLAR